MVRKSGLLKDVARVAGAREQRERVWVERIEGWRSSGQTQVTYMFAASPTVGLGTAQMDRQPRGRQRLFRAAD